MIVFDTEDNSAELLAAGKSGFDKEVTQIAAICDNGRRFHNTGNPLQFLKWCHEQGDKGTDVWAFNCQYDIGNLCNRQKYLRLYDFDLTMVKSRFIRGKLQGLNFFDVMNIAGAGQSVATLAKAVGMEKLKMDIHSKAYVFRDCEIPMKWLQFVEEQCLDMGIEKIPATLGGLCVKAFIAGGGENWHEATEESRSALMGARVELFNCGGTTSHIYKQILTSGNQAIDCEPPKKERNGKPGKFAYTDINSLYPWCMTQKFPVAMDKLDNLDGYGIAFIDIEIPAMRIAPLPWRDDEGRLLFPVGKFSGVWTIHEIKNAVRVGGKVLKIHWILGSKEGKAFYRDYIVEMYRRRLAAESPAESLFWKLLMNNLYGRLAIGGVISRSLLLTEENKHKGIPYGNKVMCDHQMPLPDFTNYLHAAHVLSYARIKLYDYLTRVPAENLVYCDTDSVIFFNEREQLPFPISKDLGEMKLECWGSCCQPFLPKTYRFDNTYKAKGVPKRHAERFIKDKTVEYESPYKMRESITFYEENNKRKLSVWRKVEKDLNANYDKKRKNGEFFLPIKINRLESKVSKIENDLFSIVSQ